MGRGMKTKLTETEKQTLAAAEATSKAFMAQAAVGRLTLDEGKAFDVAEHTARYLRAKRSGNAKRMEREAWILGTRGVSL